jgi:hypothetical protein
VKRKKAISAVSYLLFFPFAGFFDLAGLADFAAFNGFAGFKGFAGLTPRGAGFLAGDDGAGFLAGDGGVAAGCETGFGRAAAAASRLRWTTVKRGSSPMSR